MLLDHVLAHRVEVGEDVGVAFVVALELVDQRPDRRLHHLVVELAQALLALALPARRLIEALAQLLLEILDALLDALALLLGQLLELLGRRDLAVLLERRERDAHRRAQQSETALARLLLHLAEELLGEGLVLLVDDLAPGLVLVALERGRQHRAHFLGQLLELAAQAPAGAGRELEQPGLARVLEVVDVAPVGRRGPRRRHRLEERLGERVAAARGRAEDEDVVAVGVDADAELERLDRARLADAGGEDLEVGGGGEAGAGEIGAPAGLGWRRWAWGSPRCPPISSLVG